MNFEIQSDVAPSLRGASFSAAGGSSNPSLRGSANSLPSGTAQSSDMGSSPAAPTQNGGGTVSLVGESAQMFENTQFIDQNAGEILRFDVPRSHFTDADVQHNVELANYLSRPVRIATFTWNESTVPGVGTSITPWHLFMNTTSIKNKLQNYLYVRGKLHLKIIVNASPFYYGSMIFNYIPMNGLSQPRITTDAVISETIPYSQMPHVWLYPQANIGGEIVCPFFYHKAWLPITNAIDVQNMGALSYMVVNQLQSANGVTGTGVNVSIYAWMEDVQVLGTTAAGILQSDEYATGPISYPASALSRALTQLAKIPLIKPYATATSMISEGVGRLASSMGYSNPPEISDVVAFKSQPFPQLASTEISVPEERFAIDSKNELSIDPTIVGLPANDELDITYLIGRESYLNSFTFLTADAVDTRLYTCKVCPYLWDGAATSGAPINSTPLNYLGSTFGFWRGDIIFRFKVVCTQYHKGRVLLMFDPTQANSITTTTESSVVFTQVLDIGADNDVEFRVPYMQATPWLRRVTEATTRPFGRTGGTLTGSFTQTNGCIAVRVLNPLTAPVASSTISIQVFVRGAENLEFAYPDFLPNVSLFPLQTSDEIEFERPPEYIVGDSKGSHFPERYLVNMGEKITSMRQLLRRSVYTDTLSKFTALNTSSASILSCKHGRYPLYYGYDPNGVHTALGITVPASTFPFNWVKMNLFNWLSPMYIGQRGSVNWSYSADCGVGRAIADIQAFKEGSDSTRTAAQYRVTSDSGVLTNQISMSRFMLLNHNSGVSGQSFTNQITQSGVSINAPFYNEYLFNFTDPDYNALGTSIDGSSADNISVVVTNKPAIDSNSTNLEMTIHRFFSIGPDFTFYMFLCCPTFFFIATPAVNP